MDNEKKLDLVKLLIELPKEGFVRVDGLRYRSNDCGCVGIVAGGERCMENPVIRWESQSGFVAMILPNGTVWIRSDNIDTSSVLKRVMDLVRVTPIVKGCTVPFSNGESASLLEITRRVANPDWKPPYRTIEEARAVSV